MKMLKYKNDMKEKIYKAVAFLRVSTVAQHLESQKQEVYNAIHRHGYNDDEILCIEQKESAIKLAAEDRLSLQQLYHSIEKHKTIEFVFVYEISRLTRQSRMMYEIRDFLIEHHVNLYCLKPEFTLLDKDFKMSQTASILFSLFTSLSESEMMIKKERMKRGIEYKKQQGLHAGGNPAIGYDVDKSGHFIINEEGAAMVRRIFNEYADGKSVRQLARELQAEGWRANTAFLTVCQSLLNILHREYYCGTKTYPQIISRELFEKCKCIAKHKLVYHKPYMKEALLKGIIRDMETGYLMSGNMSAKSMQYYCKRYGKTTISMKAADMLVAGLAEEWYNNIANVKIKEIREAIKTDIVRCEAVIRQQEKNITDNQDKIDRIEERYLDGKLSKEKADALEAKTFEAIQFFRRTLTETQNKIVELREQLNNGKPNVHTVEEKVRYVVESVYVRRLSRFVCEVKAKNKWTGEVRIYEMNTRMMKIIKFNVEKRPTLNSPC